jgi:hypothetical protein
MILRDQVLPRLPMKNQSEEGSLFCIHRSALLIEQSDLLKNVKFRYSATEQLQTDHELRSLMVFNSAA